MIKFCIATLLVLLFSSAQAKLYQYEDADGNVYFTDVPPIGANVQEYEAKGGKSSTANVEKLHAEREARVKAKEATAKATVVSEQAAKDQEIRDKNCEIAQERLRFYNDNAGRRIRVKNAEGEYIYKTAEETIANTEAASKLVDEWCNPPKPQEAERADGAAQPQ